MPNIPPPEFTEQPKEPLPRLKTVDEWMVGATPIVFEKPTLDEVIAEDMEVRIEQMQRANDVAEIMHQVVGAPIVRE